MKVFSTIFLLILVSEFLERSSGALPNVGSCTYREFHNKVRSCNTAFFVAFRNDPNGQCSPKLAAFRDCFVKKVLQCRPGTSESIIRRVVNSQITEETFCHNAGIQDPNLDPHKAQIPCSSTYFQKIYGCANETLALWRTNKADSRLCSAFSKAITCEKTLIDRECRFTGAAKELVDLNHDGYNPFCAPTASSGASSKPIGLMLLFSLLLIIATA